MGPAPDDRWAGYRRTVIELLWPGRGVLVVRPAATGTLGAWPWPSPAPVYVLTAWDPGEKRPGDEVNRHRQAMLEAELRPAVRDLWAAIGIDPASGRREEGAAVRGITEAQARAAGARYGQDAIFTWTPREWAVVACAGGRRLSGGWMLQ